MEPHGRRKMGASLVIKDQIKTKIKMVELEIVLTYVHSPSSLRGESASLTCYSELPLAPRHIVPFH